MLSGGRPQRVGKRRCKMRAWLGAVGMVLYGARYPYSSVRQDARNKRKFDKMCERAPSVVAGVISQEAAGVGIIEVLPSGQKTVKWARWKQQRKTI